jgi:hypothetical protein
MRKIASHFGVTVYGVAIANEQEGYHAMTLYEPLDDSLSAEQRCVIFAAGSAAESKH